MVEAARAEQQRRREAHADWGAAWSSPGLGAVGLDHSTVEEASVGLPRPKGPWGGHPDWGAVRAERVGPEQPMGKAVQQLREAEERAIATAALATAERRAAERVAGSGNAEPTPSEVLSEALYGAASSRGVEAGSAGSASSAPTGRQAATHETLMTIRAEQALGKRMAEELADAHAASSRPGGASVELEQCRATLGGLEEAYYRERGDFETEVPEAVGALIYQGGSPTLEDSPEGTDTEGEHEDPAVGYVERVSRG